MLTLGPWQKPRRYDIRIVDKLTGVHVLILCCVYVTSLCLNIVAILFFFNFKRGKDTCLSRRPNEKAILGLLKFSSCRNSVASYMLELTLTLLLYF